MEIKIQSLDQIHEAARPHFSVKSEDGIITHLPF